MARSINDFLAQRRGLPFKAFLRREDPLTRADGKEFEQACRRCAGGLDVLVYAGSRGAEVGCRVICFASPLMAEDMRAWIESSGIETRPLPKAAAGARQLEVG